MEKWVAIPEFDGYEASDVGRIRSIERIDTAGCRRKGRILKQYCRPDGYLIVNLCTGQGRQTRCRVHRLVLATFIGKPNPNSDGRHINGIKNDNRLTNLAWGTRSENERDKVSHGKSNHGERNGNYRYSDNDIREVKRLRNNGASFTKIANIIGMSSSSAARFYKDMQRKEMRRVAD